MRKFEYIEILKPDTTEENIEKHIEKITKYLKNKNCQNIKVEKIGIKLLAYMIKGHEKGFYILFKTEAEKKQYKQIAEYLYTKNTSFCKAYPEVIKNISIMTDNGIRFSK